MSPESNIDPTPPHGESEAARHHAPPTPTGWREAIMTLVASRLAIIEIESKEFANETIRRTSLILIASCLIFFAWALFLVSSIAWIAELTERPWSQITLSMALVHLLGALFFARMASSSRPPSFSATRAEFKKDREWIENCEKTQKSSN
ncbi:MAG: phage holin family protein [Akkermansiaceae bacterium]|nr:phage holin family protein [Akkermansiaceae bacterium]